MPNIDKPNGFTLMEVIFVLGVWAILLLLSAPLNFTILENQTEKQFFQTFELDVLYTQNISYSTVSKDNIRLRFNPEDHNYQIIQGTPSKTLVERTYPDDWIIDHTTLPRIAFNKKGTIIDPGTFRIHTKNATYIIVFPLGKSRCYIVKE